MSITTRLKKLERRRVAKDRFEVWTSNDEGATFCARDGQQLTDAEMSQRSEAPGLTIIKVIRTSLRPA